MFLFSFFVFMILNVATQIIKRIIHRRKETHIFPFIMTNEKIKNEKQTQKLDIMLCVFLVGKNRTRM